MIDNHKSTTDEKLHLGHKTMTNPLKGNAPIIPQLHFYQEIIYIYYDKKKNLL